MNPPSLKDVIEGLRNKLLKYHPVTIYCRTPPDKRQWKIDRFQNERFFPVDNDGNFYHPESQNDMVNSPSHYTRGTQEAIDIIEEAIQDAPDVKSGMLQAQALKYLLRLWLKGNAPQDSEKAQWYLTRLIDHLKENK